MIENCIEKNDYVTSIKTNGDKVRCMTDDEISDWFW